MCPFVQSHKKFAVMKTEAFNAESLFNTPITVASSSVTPVRAA